MLNPDEIELNRNQKIAFTLQIWTNRLNFLSNSGLSVEHILGYSVEDLMNEPEQLTTWWRKNRDEAYRIRETWEIKDINPNEVTYDKPKQWWNKYVVDFMERFR